MSEKKKILIFFLIVIIVGLGFWRYKHQQNIKECKQNCTYNTWNELWEYKLENSVGREYFPEKEQCLDYCLIMK
jgi:hypothetical protein